MSNSTNNCSKCQSTITRTSGTIRRQSDLCDKCYDLKYIRKCTVCDSTYNIKTSYNKRKWNYVNMQKTTLITDAQKEARCLDCHTNNSVQAICLCCKNVYGQRPYSVFTNICLKCCPHFSLYDTKQIYNDSHNNQVLEFDYNLFGHGQVQPIKLYAPISKLHYSQITDDIKNKTAQYFNPYSYHAHGFRVNGKYYNFANSIFVNLKVVPYP